MNKINDEFEGTKFVVWIGDARPDGQVEKIIGLFDTQGEASEIATAVDLEMGIDPAADEAYGAMMLEMSSEDFKDLKSCLEEE